MNVHIDSRLAEDHRRELIFAGDIFTFSARPSVFYMFSDPDFLYANALYGESERAYANFSLFAGIIVTWLLLEQGAQVGAKRHSAGLTGGDCVMNIPQPFITPIYDFTEVSGFAFYPDYFDRPIKNGSHSFNYYEWNATGRRNSAKHVASDTRKQPKPEEELDLSSDVRLVIPAGSVMLFSGAQLHATVDNTSGRSRFSIDFRTAHVDDLWSDKGAPSVDACCSGTSLRDLMRGADGEPLPGELVKRYDSGVTDGAVLVYQPD